ncbi:MFS transporter [Actinospica durhamensis]|uniref:MFS transporter n=1 Tax=Actinospica durhamensis TaxID=1508375 RepID=A0A941EN16_9ACTN|nr:MFS transporter [Actinospica durhamensis]MBR7833373.1 MFS transporter [Actinospica durhamensis]
MSSGPLADPRFRRLLAGQALSSFGDAALYLMLGIWAKELTNSDSAAGAVFLALGLPAFLGPLVGQLADRVRRRPLLIATNAVAGVVVLALLAVHGRDQLWIIYAVAFGYGLASGILSSAGAGLRKSLLGDEQAAAGNAMLQSVTQALRVAAPLVGTGLFVAVGGGVVAILDSATFVAAIVALVTIRLDEGKRRADHADHGGRGSSFRAEVTAGFRHIRSVPLLFQVTLVTGCAFAVIGLTETVIFAVVDQGLHRSPAFLSVLNTVQGAAAAGGGLVASLLLRRLGVARVVGLALGAFGIASLFYMTDSTALCLCGSIGDGFGLVWLVVGLSTAAQVHTPSALQGRVNSAWTMAVLAPQSLSIAAGTWLIAVVDYRVLLLAITVTMAVCAAMLLIRPAAAPDPAVEPVPEPAPEAASEPAPEIVAEPVAELATQSTM